MNRLEYKRTKFCMDIFVFLKPMQNKVQQIQLKINQEICSVIGCSSKGTFVFVI